MACYISNSLSKLRRNITICLYVKKKHNGSSSINSHCSDTKCYRNEKMHDSGSKRGEPRVMAGGRGKPE